MANAPHLDPIWAEFPCHRNSKAEAARPRRMPLDSSLNFHTLRAGFSYKFRAMLS